MGLGMLLGRSCISSHRLSRLLVLGRTRGCPARRHRQGRALWWRSLRVTIANGCGY